jgi:hypothetical protein
VLICTDKEPRVKQQSQTTVLVVTTLAESKHLNVLAYGMCFLGPSGRSQQ